MVRRTMTVLAVIGCLVLSGCAYPPFPCRPRPLRDQAASDALAVGVCLADANGYDSDRRSVVECTEPHLYDVVGSAEWPGMDDAIAESGGARETFDLIVDHRPGPVVAAYDEWADEFCSTALRDVVGWSTGMTDRLWVMPSVAYQVDRSLASRSDFVAGDHLTLCSAAWWEPLAYDSEITVESMLEAEFPLETRDCWVEFERVLRVRLLARRTSISGLGFDGLAAFGIDFIRNPDEMAEEDWGRVSDKCWELATFLLPAFDGETMYTWASAEGEVWEELATGTPDADQRYFFRATSRCTTLVLHRRHLRCHDRARRRRQRRQQQRLTVGPHPRRRDPAATAQRRARVSGER